MPLTRRDLLKKLGLLAAGGGVIGPNRAYVLFTAREEASTSIPLVHTTDLYHPPQDPDDQIDLATVCALQEYDLKGVVLDVTERFLHEAPHGFDIARAPGHVPVAQMAHLTGKDIPVAQGPVKALRHPGDTWQDASAAERAGIEMILDILAESTDPVTVSVTGSPRALTAAYNRDPTLVKERTRSVLLNVGSTGGDKVEWNVQLDVQAYVGLWRSDLPIHWFPPGTDRSAFDPAHERGTFWRTTHAELFKDIPEILEGYFAYALTEDRSEDSIRAMEGAVEGEAWRALLPEERNLWSTASLVMGAGRGLVKTDGGWRFLPTGDVQEGQETWPWGLDPIHVRVHGEGTVAWEKQDGPSERTIFWRRPGRAFGEAMTEALNALFRSFVPGA